MMNKLLLAFLFASTICRQPNAQQPLDSLLPVRGFCIAAPAPADLDPFLKFIKNELAPRRVNTLVLRVDFNYQFEKHPELRDSIALSKNDVKKIVTVCKENGIRIVPQINLLGHQSWAGTIHNLLRKYPEFDETPHVKMPANYQWPNADSLYCKSYCPQHPKVHEIVFSLVDEVCNAFESTAFHAGMDEVFYIGDPKCPRCAGKDRAVLFAGEVKKIRDHLAISKRELWIWGDRLLDGYTTGLGMWEASYNQTHTAIDMIPKDVVICDWHYERPDKTAIYFAMKGFRVITCPWRNPGFAVIQLHDMVRFRQESTAEMRPRFQGMMQTVWSGTTSFLKGFYENKQENGTDITPWKCFTRLYEEIGKLK